MAVSDAAELSAQIDGATAAMRSALDDTWARASRRVRRAAVRATRSSLPVRAESVHGGLWVSEQVLVAQVHQAVQDLAGARVLRISILTRDEEYDGVRLTVSVRFGQVVAPLVEALHRRVRERIGLVLGERTERDGTAGVIVEVADVHLR